MTIPLRMRVLSKVVSALERRPMSQLSAEELPAARARRQKSIDMPGAWLVVGRPHPGAVAEDATATLPDATVLPTRVYRPVRPPSVPLPVVVNFHGGGFVGGDARQSEWWCSSVAAQAAVVVVSIDYRLAPEHPFPVAPEDCYAATVWTAERAGELGVDPGRLAVMGDSAGGNLATVVAMLSRDRGGPPIALQILIYPCVEMVEKFRSEYENADAPLLTAADVNGFSRLYLAGGDGADPRWSPLRGIHGGLPPALVQTAQHDPLRDQGSVYADALRAAGVAVRYTNYVDAVHGYISVPGVMPAARQALGEVVAELERVFEPR
jgi:acetyl esterase